VSRASLRFDALCVILLVCGVAGCDAKRLRNGSNDPVAAPPGTISVYQLAGQLNMAVVDNSHRVATLRDPANTITIFPDPAGQAYVNGAPVGERGHIANVGGMLFVPRELVGRIRGALKAPARAAGPAEKLAARARPPGRIVLDPGHGGRDPGAISPIGIREKDVVLETTLLAAELLRRAGADVTLTREDDTFVPLNERADIANRLSADLFASIHADSCRDASARGFTIYVARSASAESAALARRIERRLAALGIASRGVRRANYRVLVRTACPAVLIELGYLSNITEAAKLSRPSHRRRLAEAIAEALLEDLRRR